MFPYRPVRPGWAWWRADKIMRVTGLAVIGTVLLAGCGVTGHGAPSSATGSTSPLCHFVSEYIMPNGSRVEVDPEAVIVSPGVVRDPPMTTPAPCPQGYSLTGAPTAAPSGMVRAFTPGCDLPHASPSPILSDPGVPCPTPSTGTPKR